LFVGTEVALAVVLMLCAAPSAVLMVRALSTDPGFDARGLVAVDVPIAARDDWNERRALVDDLIARVQSIPGVSDASFTDAFPMDGHDWPLSFRMDDATARDIRTIHFAVVDRRYLEFMRIPLVRGRFFEPVDRAGTENVVVLNRRAAELLSPGADPIGRFVRPDPGQMKFRVVGIVADVRQDGPHADFKPIVYRPFSQYAGPRRLTLIARTSADPTALGASIRLAIRDVDPDLAQDTAVVTAKQLLHRSRRGIRFTVAWLGGLAGLALALALIDIAGLALEGADRFLRQGLPSGKRRLAVAVVRPVVTVVVIGAALAAGLAWRLGRVELPVLRSLAAVDLTTASIVLLTLAAGILAVIGLVFLYVRSLDPVPTRRDARAVP